MLTPGFLVGSVLVIVVIFRVLFYPSRVPNVACTLGLFILNCNFGCLCRVQIKDMSFRKYSLTFIWVSPVCLKKWSKLKDITNLFKCCSNQVIRKNISGNNKCNNGSPTYSGFCSYDSVKLRAFTVCPYFCTLHFKVSIHFCNSLSHIEWMRMCAVFLSVLLL